MNRHSAAIILLLLILAASPISAFPYASNEPIPLGPLPFSYTGLPDDFLYPSYLADPLAVHSQIAFRQYRIDEIHPGSDGTEGHFDITIGTRYSFMRISPTGHPNLGIEMDWGMGLATFMDTGRTDLLGIDAIYYFALSLKPVDWAAFRLTRHHICSHAGDQLDRLGDGSEFVDFDLNPLIHSGSFVRDDYLISTTFEPFFFLRPLLPEFSKILRLYGDYSAYLPGSDLLGSRANSPSAHAYIWYQYGAELELPLAQKNLGSVFAAAQISRWQESAYAPNYSIQAGYILPDGKSGQRMKFAASLYDGQSIMNNFRNRRSRYWGIVFTIDK